MYMYINDSEIIKLHRSIINAILEATTLRLRTIDVAS